MSDRVLVLTPSMEPHRVTTWQRAITMVFLEKVEVLEEYDEILYRSLTLEVRMPAVVRLVRLVRTFRRAVKFSRSNVFARDRYCCQYCGEAKRVRELSYDHVIPRHRGGRTTWENIVTCCYPCNTKKRNRSPEQAGMTLLSVPSRPKSLPIQPGVNLGPAIPPLWEPYVSWMDPGLLHAALAG